jgi:exodeoxyribonuclease VII small subunit
LENGMAKQKSIDELTYEEAFGELETLVAALEGESRPLDESLALYERGQALAKHCAQLLERAELRVRQLAGEAEVDFEEAD